MKKYIGKDKAEELVLFAEEHNSLVEQKEFKDYDRHIISTTDGTVALKSSKHTDKCWLENFHGFDNKLVSIVDKGAIIIKGYTFV